MKGVLLILLGAGLLVVHQVINDVEPSLKNVGLIILIVNAFIIGGFLLLG